LAVPDARSQTVVATPVERDNAVQSLLIRDLRLPVFHPEEPVLFLPEGRAVVSAFSDVVVSGMAPPIPYVAPAKNGTYWYLGPLGLLVALGQAGRRLTAVVLPTSTAIDEMKVIAAKASLLRPMRVDLPWRAASGSLARGGDRARAR
jgi:hypothetical protein